MYAQAVHKSSPAMSDKLWSNDRISDGLTTADCGGGERIDALCFLVVNRNVVVTQLLVPLTLSVARFIVSRKLCYPSALFRKQGNNKAQRSQH